MQGIDYFLELAAIGNVHPNETEVLNYIKLKLKSFGIKFFQDDFGNIVATILSAENPDRFIGISGHVDIAAPLKGRQVITENNIIKTDGLSLLGGDDKTAVAMMLWLAEQHYLGQINFKFSVELIFTVGEEAGLMGAKNLNYNLVKSDDILVFDWEGSVNRIITKSPAYIKIDVKFKGKSAHPAEWQKGKNAGQFLMLAASKLKQGEFETGVTFNIGRVNIGEARNQVPGEATLEAEVRSFSYKNALNATEQIINHFDTIAKTNGITCEAKQDADAAAYELDSSSDLMNQVNLSLNGVGLEPIFEQTFGCFDGNIFTKHAKKVVILGAAYYNPHGPDEYVNVNEFNQMLEFIRYFCSN
jgi:tripeptide aminopeptidase